MGEALQDWQKHRELVYIIDRSASAAGYQECESGGIGRRTRLRIWRVKPWGFESPLSHQSLRAFSVAHRVRALRSRNCGRATSLACCWRSPGQLRDCAFLNAAANARAPRAMATLSAPKRREYAFNDRECFVYNDFKYSTTSCFS